jgi:hypothetical protein
MISLLAIAFLAQDLDWIQGAVILVIVIASAIVSAGKWIVKQIADSNERNAQRREGMPIDPPRPTAIQRERQAAHPIDSDGSDIPPIAAPMPPLFHRTRKPTTQPPAPAMERVMEVLLERASGTKLERRIREMIPQSPTPPPPPAARTSEPLVRKQTAQRQKPTRSITIAERAAHRDQTRQTEVELETQRLTQREQRFTDDTDQRLGHVVTHIAGADVHESASADPYEIASALDDADSLRRAFILSEILAPPLALRQPVHQ